MLIFDKDFIQALCYTCDTYSEILSKLEVPVNKNTVRKLAYYISKWKLDKSKMTGGRFRIGHVCPTEISLENILVENSTYTNGYALKRKLIKAGIFEKKCYKCKNTRWQEVDIPLQLEHINGVNNDNRIENLTLLCPNCHALTKTYCGRNSVAHKMKLIKKAREQERKKSEKLRQSDMLKKQKASIKAEKNRRHQLMVESRLLDLENINLKVYGWVKRLSDRWNLSHSQVRRFLKKYKPEIYEIAKQRQSRSICF